VADHSVDPGPTGSAPDGDASNNAIVILRLNLTGTCLVAPVSKRSQDYQSEVFIPPETFTGDHIEITRELLEAWGLTDLPLQSSAKGVVVTIRGLPLESKVCWIVPESEMAASTEEQYTTRIEHLIPHLPNLAMAALTYENQLASAVLLKPLPSFVSDARGRVIIANPIFCELAGCQPRAGDQIDKILTMDQPVALDDLDSDRHTEVVSLQMLKTGIAVHSEVEVSVISTQAGRRFVWILLDVPVPERTRYLNHSLLQRLSELLTMPMQPHILLRKLVNSIAVVLEADLVALLRHDLPGQLILTPYANRNPRSLRTRVITTEDEPHLAPYFSSRSPVFCSQVSTEGKEPNLISCLGISQFALVPVGSIQNADHALLVAWSRGHEDIDNRILSMLRILANLLGAGLVTAHLIRQVEEEKSNLERYARLATDREIRMTQLKRENAELRQTLIKLENGGSF